MSVRPAPQHAPAELAVVGCDDASGIAAFAVPSKPDAARTNSPALDTLTGATSCDCKGIVKVSGLPRGRVDMRYSAHEKGRQRPQL